MTVPRHPLPLIPRLLRERHAVITSYNRLHRAAMDARVPIVRDAAGRWTAADEDLLAIAAELGEPVHG